jgi:hypothetical protein
MTSDDIGKIIKHAQQLVGEKDAPSLLTYAATFYLGQLSSAEVSATLQEAQKGLIAMIGKQQ